MPLFAEGTASLGWLPFVGALVAERAEKIAQSGFGSFVLSGCVLKRKLQNSGLNSTGTLLIFIGPKGDEIPCGLDAFGAISIFPALFTRLRVLR